MISIGGCGSASEFDGPEDMCGDSGETRFVGESYAGSSSSSPSVGRRQIAMESGCEAEMLLVIPVARRNVNSSRREQNPVAEDGEWTRDGDAAGRRRCWLKRVSRDTGRARWVAGAYL